MYFRHDKVKAGIIGWGENTLLVADILSRYTKFIDFVAFSSSHKPGRDYVLRNLGVKHIYNHHNQMMDLHEIDAVIILGPKDEYAQQIIDSLKAGYHVLYELPAIVSRSTAEELIECISRHPSQICMPAISHRHDSHIKRIKENIEKGDLGEIISIEYSINRNKDKSSYVSEADMLPDILLEGLDLVFWLLKSTLVKSTTVSCHDDYRQYNLLDINGVEFHIVANRLGHAPDGSTLRIIGTKSEIVVNHPDVMIHRAQVTAGNYTTISSELDMILPYQNIINAFVYHIQEKKQPDFKAKDLNMHFERLAKMYSE